MKVALLTSFSPKAPENQRIMDELSAMGHEGFYVDLRQFSFSVEDGKLVVDMLEGINPDLIILRGVLGSIKPINTIIKSYRDRGVKVYDNNFLEQQYSIDKITDILKLNIAGVAIPKTFYPRKFDLFTECAAKIGYPVIVKSTRAGKGMGVFKLDDRAEGFL
jgi:hypothetical protein